MKSAITVILMLSLLILTVSCTPRLTGIAIEPYYKGGALVLNPDGHETAQFKATGKYSDGSTKDITAKVSWISTNPGAVSISSTGLATAKKFGEANIIARSGLIFSKPAPVEAAGHPTPSYPPGFRPNP